MPGTYVLAVAVDEPATIEVGALGERAFDRGTYAYVGSAFGPGGFSRVERHRELAAGERDARHWHVDYLLGHPAASLAAVVKFPEMDVECDLASALPGDPVPAFGASDCDCDSHLLRAPDREALLSAARAARERLG
ncbi:GIY-YIG nuclease family protein [Halostella litorea]|uniref:GIY-YIG nuclease family protein n=1 Tax=Halostella litorea TaxID=2528831 RepID=UPI001091EE32|nr:GIY-YIG nuclease family protein [Halostella litorea]